MITYTTLEKTDITVIHQAFIRAFSDYQVEMDLSLADFEKMLLRNGFEPELSVGAFVNDRLAGFIFNGFRDWNGVTTVYDTGTAVIRDFRKQGITGHMFSIARNLLQEKRIKQYLLEVIQTNTAAVELYKKQGFEITRELNCFQLEKSQYSPTASYAIEHITEIESAMWPVFKACWDFSPTWQNSMDSILAIPDTFICSIVRLDGAIAGYGLIDKKTGAIPQIAVNKNYRNRKIGKRIIADLLQQTESNKISIVNVDAGSKATVDFLLHLGFMHSVSQYEMLLKL